MISKNRTRSFLKNYCSGDGSCECIQLDQRVLQKLAFNAESPFHNINRSRAFTPVLDHCVSESSMETEVPEDHGAQLPTENH